jgi:hypothetical protein
MVLEGRSPKRPGENFADLHSKKRAKLWTEEDFTLHVDIDSEGLENCTDVLEQIDFP